VLPNGCAAGSFCAPSLSSKRPPRRSGELAVYSILAGTLRATSAFKRRRPLRGALPCFESF
jgi:hypothetical protein